MEVSDLIWPAVILFAVVGVGMPVLSMISGRRRAGAQRERGARNEALFQSMFPELQPHFHPERLVEYVSARLARGRSPAEFLWTDPAGFPAASRAQCAPGEKGRERVRLLDESGAAMSEFHFEKVPEGAALRVGRGKLTVDLRKHGDPRVRYWHPEREFKWSKAGWVFKTPVADEPFEATRSETGSSTSDTSSGMARSAAAGAAVAGLGGSFDGGGASAGWDPAPSGAGSSSSSEGAWAGASAAGATSSDSGPSSGDGGGDSSGDSTGGSLDTSY